MTVATKPKYGEKDRQGALSYQGVASFRASELQCNFNVTENRDSVKKNIEKTRADRETGNLRLEVFFPREHTKSLFNWTKLGLSNYSSFSDFIDS